MTDKNLRPVDRLVLAAARGELSRRRLIRRATALGLSLPALNILLSRAPGAAAQATPTPTGQITMSMNAEPDTLESWYAYAINGHPVLRNIQEALINRNPKTNELVGELATKWEQTDDKTWRFHLRQGVKFHNGDPFNAEVAAFGINYTWAPNKFEIYQFVGPDMTAKAVDDYTVDVTTVEPDPILPSRLYFSPIPNMNEVKNKPDSLATNPIGTGPYKFVAWNRGEDITLTANPDWWGIGATDAHGAVTIKDVKYVFRAESSVRASQVTAGEAQIGRFLAPEDCQTTPVCKESQSVETLFLRLDTMNPVMKDIRIRKAIAFAVDKQAVADQLFGGGKVASQLVGPSATGYDPNLKPYPFDLDQAKKLVAEAKADGVPVEDLITVAVRAGAYPRADEFGEYIANQLKTIGLNAKSVVIEPAQYQEQYVMPRDKIPPERGWIGTLTHGNEIMDLSTTMQSYYRCAGAASTYCDPELDKEIEQALPLTGDARVKAFQAITEKFYQAYAAIPILHLPLDYGLAANLIWEPRLDGFMLVKEMSYK